MLLLGVVAALTWGDFGLRLLVPALQTPHWPNPGYWIAGRLALEGNAGLIYADRAVFFQQAARLGTVPDIFEANMPTTVLVFLPVAGLTETTARTIWDIAMLLCYIAACAILFRALMLPRLPGLALWALAPLFHPWRENISWGQIYPLLLLLLVAGAVLGLRSPELTRRTIGLRPSPSGPAGPSPKGPRTPLVGDGRSAEVGSADAEPRRILNIRSKDGPAGWSDFAAGLAFGAIAIAKLYYGLVLLLPAVVWRRWKVLAGAATLFAFAAAVTLALWGGELWVRAIGFAISWRDRPESAVTAYQTLNGLLTHLLRYDATFNQSPVANLPELAGWLWWAGAAVMVAATTWVLWPVGNYELRITNYELDNSPVVGGPTSARLMLGSALIVPVALVLAPIAEDYHYVLALFPLLVVGKVLWDMYSGERRSLQLAIDAAALLAAALLLSAPWRFNVFNVPDVVGWRVLIALSPALWRAHPVGAHRGVDSCRATISCGPESGYFCSVKCGPST